MDQKLKATSDEYEKSLILPDKKPGTQIVIGIVGTIGSGKTTIATLLAEKLSLVRLSGDDIRVLMKRKGMGYDSLSEIFWPLFEAYLEKGYSIVVDRDAATPRTKQNIEEMAQKHGARALWIRVTAPEETIIDRIRKGTYPRGIFDNAEQALKNRERRENLHEEFSMPFAYVFDASKEDALGQIERCVSAIRRAE